MDDYQFDLKYIARKPNTSTYTVELVESVSQQPIVEMFQKQKLVTELTKSVEHNAKVIQKVQEFINVKDAGATCAQEETCVQKKPEVVNESEAVNETIPEVETSNVNFKFNFDVSATYSSDDDRAVAESLW